MRQGGTGRAWGDGLAVFPESVRTWRGVGAVLTLATVLALVLPVTTAARQHPDVRVPIVPLWRVGPDVPPPPAPVRSAAAVLMDPRSGTLLYEHAGFVRRPPASTTKILTAYIVIRRGHLDEVVRVSGRAAATPGSRMHLHAGERLRVRDLLTGLLLRSGNDAAEALAETVDGTRERFALRMNRTARSLGALGSHFANPHGLPDPQHYTTAYDLAKIATAALTLPEFRRLVATQHATVRDLSGRVFDMTNTNRLLGEFAGASGVKTGTTNAAGQCLVAAADRGGFPLLSVVLRSSDRWDESAALLRWGYSAFAPLSLGPRPGEAVGRLPVGGLRPAWADVTVRHRLEAVVPRRLVGTAHVEIWSRGRLPRTIHIGDTVGVASLVVGGRTAARTALVVARLEGGPVRKV